MPLTGITGPFVAFGITQTSSGAVQEYNPDRGPSLFDLGQGTMDPRPVYRYQPGSAPGIDVNAFYQGRAMVDFAPFTASSVAFVDGKTQTPAGNSLTIFTSKSAIGNIPTTIVAPETGQNVSVFAIDSTAATLIYGSTAGNGTIGVWNPAAGTGRLLQARVTSCGIQQISFAGRDMYGFKITELASAPTSSDANDYIWTSKKAFKYLSAISYSTVGAVAGITSTGVSVGFIDTFGFPILLSRTGLGVYYNVVGTASAAVIASTGAVTLGATATATSTTGDVRGTYASTTAANGTVRIQMSQDITPLMAWTVAATSSDTTVSPIFGVTQFSSV